MLDYIATFVRQALSGVAQLLVQCSIAALLGPDELGLYTVSFLIPHVFAQVATAGLPTANAYMIATNRFSPQVAWTASRDLTLLLSSGALVLNVAILTMQGDLGSEASRTVVPLLCVSCVPLLAITMICIGILQGMRAYRSVNRTALLQPYVLLTGITIIWATQELTLVKVVALTAISHLCGLAGSLWAISQFVNLFQSGSNRSAYLKDALCFGAAASVGNLLTGFIYRSDVLFVSSFFGDAATGLYVLAVRLCEQLWIVSNAIASVLFTRLAALGDNPQRRRLITARAASAALWTTSAGAVLLIGCMVLFKSVFLVNSFVEVSRLTYFLIPGTIGMAAVRVLSADSAARGFILVNLGIAGLALIVNLCGNLLLLPLFGVDGAAITTSASYLLMLCSQLAVQLRVRGVDAVELVVAMPRIVISRYRTSARRSVAP